MSGLSRLANLGLRAKLTLLIEGVMLLLGVATGMIATVRTKTTLETELTKRGLAIAGDLAMFSVKPLLANDLATLRRFVNHSLSQDHVRYVSVLDPDGMVVMHSNLGELGKRLDDPLTRKALASETAGYSGSAAGGRGEPIYDVFFPITAANARLGTVMLGYSRAAAETEIAQARRQIVWVWLLTAALAGLLAFMLSSYISTPITKIAAAMQSTSEGTVRAVLDVRRHDEIGILASSFNSMAEDLSRHRKHLEELVEARTAELSAANVLLENEIAERRKAEDDLRSSREELRDLASHLQSVREQERTDIAREIHDELGQTLTALKMDTHWVSQRVRGAQPAVVAKVMAMAKTIDGTIQTVRRISSELRPRLLDDLGLTAALEWQARDFAQRAGIACDFRSEPDDIVLDQPRSTALFRICQETLTNVARHARASRVHVVIKQSAGSVEMTVSDDGIGITPAQVSDARSLGIVGMRERVRSLGGEIDITGSMQSGTTIRVSIPG